MRMWKTVWYVHEKSGSDKKDGLSPKTALKTVKQAIENIKKRKTHRIVIMP